MLNYNSQLQKVINLAKITGHRIIIIDKNNSEDIFVIINFNEYEKMISKKITENNSKNELKDLTEQKSLDKINQDIAFWKNENDLDVLDNKWENDKYCKWDEDDKEEYGDEDEDEYEYDDDDEIVYDRYNGVGVDDNKINTNNPEYYNINDESDNFNKREELTNKKFNHWQIPSQVKQKAKNMTEEETRSIITSL